MFTSAGNLDHVVDNINNDTLDHSLNSILLSSKTSTIRIKEFQIVESNEFDVDLTKIKSMLATVYKELRYNQSFHTNFSNYKMIKMVDLFKYFCSMNVSPTCRESFSLHKETKNLITSGGFKMSFNVDTSSTCDVFGFKKPLSSILLFKDSESYNFLKLAKGEDLLLGELHTI